MEPTTLLLLGGAAFFLMSRGKKQHPMQAVTGKSGRSWLARVDSVADVAGQKVVTTSLFAPREVGQPLWVTTYRQTGSDKASRVVVAINPEATSDLVTAAGTDFGIKKA